MSTGAIAARRHCSWFMAAAIIAATGTGSPKSCATAITSSRPTCAAMVTAHGPSPKVIAERAKTGYAERFRKWIDDKRQAAGRTPRRYATLDDALARMMGENAYLTEAQARHLTIHGISRNEDGTWSWKFDNYLNIWPAFDMPQDDIAALWGAIACPTLLLYGANSWASNPERDGRLRHFKTATVIEFENAGHWLHHDQFARFMSTLDEFL